MHFNTSHVTVYLIPYSNSSSVGNISIHLMLRFIMPGSRILHAVSRISIHLMLRFIISNNSHHRGSKSISIHLMLRFILRRLLANILEKFHFNTSHVTVYLINTSFLFAFYHISIHLMLRFIHQQWIFPASRLAISIHLMLRFIEPIRDCPSECLEFQYISCYGLSNAPPKHGFQ